MDCDLLERKKTKRGAKGTSKRARGGGGERRRELRICIRRTRNSCHPLIPAKHPGSCYYITSFPPHDFSPNPPPAPSGPLITHHATNEWECVRMGGAFGALCVKSSSQLGMQLTPRCNREIQLSASSCSRTSPVPPPPLNLSVLPPTPIYYYPILHFMLLVVIGSLQPAD
jgi:hypothetical protein